MHIVMLSDQEAIGGAGIAASRLADGLVARGMLVTRIVHAPDGAPHAWKTIPCPPLANSIESLERLLRDSRPDAISIHNIHGGQWAPLAMELVASCARMAPTFWTLHDTWSFTGRCAYTYDCTRFMSGCDAACPTPTEYPELAPDRIAPAWRARQTLLREHPRLTAVTPSRWLADEAKKGLWARHRVEVIPYDLPLDVYRPEPRADARARLGLSREGLVVLAIAEYLSERRKGGGLLAPALQSPNLPPMTLLTVGEEAPTGFGPGIHSHPLGYTRDVQAIATAYNAADVVLHAAPVDNFPNVMLEALACGTPVVAFRTGGVPEIVRPDVTGWLAPEITAESLGSALSVALAEISGGRKLRRECRLVAESEFASGTQADRYLSMFAQR
jgi:glycosyltransferase involved in cell wall biosynthesis